MPAPWHGTLPTLSSMLVISPHLDDAVFGCGRLIAAHPGSVVVTVFAGVPRHPERLTEWDAACGFRNAAEAIATRRREDQAALALLDATPRWLDFCDSQYDETASPAELAAALGQAIANEAPDRVLYPLGIFHSDHLLVHDAAVAALRAWPDLPAFAFEDALYRGMRGELQQRLAALARARFSATPARLLVEGAEARKAQAVQAYASQMRAFGPNGVADTAQPERYWRLERESPAEEDTE
jgi:LmbE family N-acetylglucosaminyl deacetylase